jgi:hypothetical protein
VQTVGQHLHNYLLYNRRTPDDISRLLASLKKNYAGGAQKHMEIVSLDVLLSLRDKNWHNTISAVIELPFKQIDYIKQVADEYKPNFGAEIEEAF